MEIVPGVHLLQFTFVNVFLIDTGDPLVMVDAGIPGSGRQILSYLMDLRRLPADLEAIAITHCHFDHVGALAVLSRATGAQVCASQTDAAVISGQARQFRPPLNRPVRFLGRALGAFVKPAAVRVDRILRDGDRVGPLVVVASPGHTLGHLCYYWPEPRTLFAGDSMVTQPRLRGPLEDFTEDMAEAHRSLRRLSELDVETLCVSHGAPILAGAGVQLRRMTEALA
ncbi:MAG: MBL fold metallo-hydrolase [Chloroflexota bacterium]|nr:MBL fold metallo-hydrolase [Chloroflexota bacterium]